MSEEKKYQFSSVELFIDGQKIEPYQTVLGTVKVEQVTKEVVKKITKWVPVK